MPEPTILEMAGAQPKRPPKFRPISIKRFFSGLYTQRNPLMDPGSRADERFYGGTPDTLIDGLNMELTNAGIWARRPGWVPYSTAALDGTPLAFYSWRKLNGTVEVLAATADKLYSFTPTAATVLYTKSGTGKMFFCAVGDVLYFADGTTAQRYDGTTVSGWGIAAPIASQIRFCQVWPAGANWLPSHAYAVEAGASPVGVVDLNGNTQVVTAAGTSGSVPPSWNTAVGGSTTDGGVTWLNLGAAATQPRLGGTAYAVGSRIRMSGWTWICSTAGTSAPGDLVPGTVVYGQTVADGTVRWVVRGYVADTGPGWSAATSYAIGQRVTDPWGNLQLAQAPGTSGASQPVWNRATQGYTYDGSVLWMNMGADPIAGMFATSGFEYALSFVTNWGHYSTATPVPPVTTGPLNNQVVEIGGASATNPSVNGVALFRTTDGGADYLYLGETLPPEQWYTPTYIDRTPDGSLNTEMPAPIAHANDPAPGGLGVICYHVGRMWGAVGNLVYFSGGPDTLVGNGNEAWPPANNFTFPSPVQALLPQSGGLMVLTVDGMYFIRGSDLTSFYVQAVTESMGIRSPNAITLFDGGMFAFTSKGQLFAITPTGITEVGFAIGDLLQQFAPTAAAVAWHAAGTSDQALYVCDGASTIYRLNPQQPPELNAAWSTRATPAGGVSLLQSVETSPGVWQLLMAQPGTGTVLARSLSTFSDNGTPYPAYMTVGSLVLAEPGNTALMDSLTVQATNGGAMPSLSVLLDEISGTFTPLNTFVSDPPQLPAPVSMRAGRYYMSQQSQPQICRHLQVMASLATAATADEILSLGINASIQEDD